MKIIYAGTPEFAVPALQALIDADYEVVAVYTQPDRPTGRGRKLAMSSVKQLALENSIPVEQPLNFKSNETLEQLKSYQADIMIVAAYGLILPQIVLESFEFGCINIHASILPRWRGAAPIQRAIIAGDDSTGVCIMKMEKGLDTGPVYHKKIIEILPEDTGSSLHDRLMQLGADALMQTLPGIFSNSIKPVPQNGDTATYAHKLEKLEAKIDWQESAELIQRKIRAFNAWPVAFCELNGENVRIWEADFNLETHNRQPGEIVGVSKTAITVACSEGLLTIHALQLPGGKMLTISQVINAKKELFKIGTLFS